MKDSFNLDSVEAMERIHCSLSAHGSSQMELKITYPFLSMRNAHFQTEVFIQIPKQISISLDERGRKALLDDTHSRTRFTVANVPLSWLTDNSSPDSPLGRILREIRRPAQPGRVNEERIVYELRTFGNLYTVQLKSLVRVIQASIRDPAYREDGLKAGRETLRDVKKALQVFRELRPALMDPSLSPRVLESHALTDEYLGDQTVRYLLGLTSMVSRDISLDKLGAQLEKFLQKEVEHQTERGYKAVRSDTIDPQDGRALEQFIIRENRLKKWVQNVLYLDVAESGVPRQVGHILAGLAAATAMSVAVLAAFFAERMYNSYSLPWALLIVGSYIVKDRIKEILRSALIRFVPMAVSDRTRILHDPANNRNMGRARLSLRRGRLDEIPPRPTSDSDSATLSATVERDTLVFASTVRLRGNKLQKSHRRANGVMDITRIRIDQWLRDLDAPVKNIRILNAGSTLSVSGPRTYELLVTARITSPQGEEIRHWTIILDRNGIRRVERR